MLLLAQLLVTTLTDSLLSPIATHASYRLLAHSDMASIVDSLVAPLSLINALIVAAGHKKDADVSQIFNRLEGIWEDYGVFGQSNET